MFSKKEQQRKSVLPTFSTEATVELKDQSPVHNLESTSSGDDSKLKTNITLQRAAEVQSTLVSAQDAPVLTRYKRQEFIDDFLAEEIDKWRRMARSKAEKLRLSQYTDDIVHDIVVYLLECLEKNSLPYARQDGDFIEVNRGMLAGACVLRLKGWRRKKVERMNVTAGSFDASHPEVERQEDTDFRRIKLQEEARELVEDYLTHLSQDERDIVCRNVLHGESNKEIAGDLGLHPDTVGKRVKKALAKLRKIAEEMGEQ